MAKVSYYKCRFKHCAHEDGKVRCDEAVKINKGYWHQDCYATSQIISELVEDYIENISSTVVVSLLRKVINEIVFGKKLYNKNIPKSESDLNAARYLEFAFQFAINHNIRVTHPQGLYYLIDNAMVKEAWKKKDNAEIQREQMNNVNNSDITNESGQTTFKIKKANVGFEGILGGLTDE